jgi:hypothetical protein
MFRRSSFNINHNKKIICKIRMVESGGLNSCNADRTLFLRLMFTSFKNFY